MARADVEVVRQAFGAWQRLVEQDLTAEELASGEQFDSSGAFFAFAERFWDPDVVYEEDPRWPGATVYRGRDSVMAAFAQYREVLEPSRFELEDVFEGPKGLVALMRIAGASIANAVPFEHLWAYLVEVRDGRVTRFRAYFDPGDATAAAAADRMPPG